MRFEDQIISFKPKSLAEDPDKMGGLLEKAKDSDKKRPDMYSFKDIYDEKEIIEDDVKVKKLKKKWNEENNKYFKFMRDFSTVYETAVMDILDKNKFLGENNEIIPASEYDDIFNGIDGVLIIHQDNLENEYVGLNFDVTFSSTDKNIEEKIESIKQCIREGVLPTLKYFQDPKTKEHKKISLPKIIIGSQQSSADGLVRLWGKSDENNSEKLKNHPVQSKIIVEALSQLGYFYDFAKNLAEKTREDDKREKYNDICIKYQKMHRYFYNIYLAKKDLIESHYNEIINDTVYQEIIKLTREKK